MAQDTFHQSVWAATTPAGPVLTPLTGKTKADVAIVGAGFLGLSTALHLAERGAQVVVLEAAEPGFGASGRNTGFVVPSLWRGLGPAAVRQRWGERGERLVSLVGASGSALFDLIRRRGLDCEAEQLGWIQPAHSADAANVLQERRREWTERGKHLDWLGPTETERLTGVSGYHGALLDRSGGQLNPLAYARELARRAIGSGARLHARSKVRAIEHERPRWRVRTDAGEVVADRVLLATNALVGALAPTVARAMIPIVVHQIATSPLSERVRDSILPGGQCLSDTRRHTFACRWGPGNRLLTGGIVAAGPLRLARARRSFERRLGRFFPRHGPFTAEFAWRGIIATLPELLPRFFRVESDLEAAIGCNGRGVALTTSLGREIARLYAGEIGEDEFPAPITVPQSAPLRSLAAIGPSIWLPWSELRDWLDAKRCPPAIE
jgi:glycine/D-amino acid oxidase-like deaminating enzyme